MRIGVFGLGYVGCVTAACLADAGHEVVGVDLVPAKVDQINRGHCPIIEDGLDTLIERNVASGRLRATLDGTATVAATDLSLICVGTPSLANGGLDIGAVHNVCAQIGRALRSAPGRHVVVLRSTVLPGTMRGIIQPILEQESGRQAGQGFGLANNPEFLREGTAVRDFYNPPKTVIGAGDAQTAHVVRDLFAPLGGPMILTDIDVAEMVKYADNAWHAVKVAFGNEIGNFCQTIGVDSHAVMDIFCQDTKLNLSPYYLKPGFAFGGSCLPKDLRALTHRAQSFGLRLPLLESVLPSNREQIDRAARLIDGLDVTRIGILGFSFKAGTDDLRESPVVDLIERLIGKGYDLRLHDRSIELSQLQGANRNYILNVVPHISRLLAGSAQAILDHAQLVILGNGDPAYHAVFQRLRPDQKILDMVRAPEAATHGMAGRYIGINW